MLETYPNEKVTLVDRIDAVLPQTQCTQCGFSGCRPYAQAMAENQAPINRCPPGGEANIQTLAQLLKVSPLSLDPTCGAPTPFSVAVIEEAHCIGCTLCIQACPVDAIVGTHKRMHTVLNDWCTGCGLCVAPCPVDCISMQPAQREWTIQDANQARDRYQARQSRSQEAAQESLKAIKSSVVIGSDIIESLETKGHSPANIPSESQVDPKRLAIEQAVMQARIRRKAYQLRTSSEP